VEEGLEDAQVFEEFLNGFDGFVGLVAVGGGVVDWVGRGLELGQRPDWRWVTIGLQLGLRRSVCVVVDTLVIKIININVSRL